MLDFWKKNYKMIAIDLGKQLALDADPNVIQHINFNVNLEPDNDAIVFFIMEKKETFVDFSQGIFKVLLFPFVLI